MFSVNENQDAIAFKLSSEMQLVDRVIRECGTFAGQYQYTKLDSLKTVVRELLINAIEHGNKSSISSPVECDIEFLGSDRFKVTVKDQGEGFDHEGIDLFVPDDPEQDRSRGLPLVNALADELSFNETGNEITAWIVLPQDTDFEISGEDGVQVITPTGDMTASSADKLRIILLEMLDQGETAYRFDLKKVDDIDSISLSLLITFAKMLQKKSEGGKLEIINAKDDLISLFELTRLNRIYTLA